MTRNSEGMYWHSNKEWYRIDEEHDCYVLTENAPERAKKSFQIFLEANRKGA